MQKAELCHASAEERGCARKGKFRTRLEMSVMGPMLLFGPNAAVCFPASFLGQSGTVVGIMGFPALRGPDVTVCAVSFQCCPSEFIS